MSTVKYKFDDFFNPVLQVLKKLGRSGNVEEINTKVFELLEIPSDQTEILHNPDKGGITELEYRLMWTRTYLKQYGLIDNSSRGIWALTEKGSKSETVDQKVIVQFVRDLMKNQKEKPDDGVEDPNEVVKWQEKLLTVLMGLEAPQFERLVQRILRESGFTKVEVTGRTGDGGIDGHGTLRLGGFLSFHVIFQAKKWKSSVGSREVRDFRGAFVGRADRGILITTATFTNDAQKEAKRDGAPVIDLIDGDQLVEKLKDLSLGVSVKQVVSEQVTIDEGWFLRI